MSENDSRDINMKAACAPRALLRRAVFNICSLMAGMRQFITKGCGIFLMYIFFFIMAALIMYAAALYGAHRYEENKGYAFSERVGVSFSNAADVVDAIRTGLRKHDTAMYISYTSADSSEDDMRAMTDELMEFALMETADPKEGDYIRYQCGGYTLTYSREELETDRLWRYRLRIVPDYYMDPEQDAEVDAEVEKVLAELEDEIAASKSRPSELTDSTAKTLQTGETSGIADNEPEQNTIEEANSKTDAANVQQSGQGLAERLFGSLGRHSSDYDKLRAVYDYLYDNVAYDTVRSNHRGYHLKTTAYAALIQHTAVCQGYSVAMYRLLRELGVDCRIITGMAEYDGVSEYHSWNIVRIDGVYYNIDPTWDRALNTHDYFLKSDASFTDHVRDEQFTTEAFYEQYPMAESDYDW